jgi:hypothetical protein
MILIMGLRLGMGYRRRLERRLARELLERRGAK